MALGKKLGPKMKAVAAALAAFTQEQIATLEKEGSISLLIDNEPVILQIQEVEIPAKIFPAGWWPTKTLLRLPRCNRNSELRQ